MAAFQLYLHFVSNIKSVMVTGKTGFPQSLDSLPQDELVKLLELSEQLNQEAAHAADQMSEGYSNV